MAEQQASFFGQLESVIRQGAKDLHNAIVPAFPTSIHGVDEPGTPLTPTSQMVTEDLKASPNYEAMLNGYANRQPPQQEPGLER